MDNLIPIIFILIMFWSIYNKIRQQKKKMAGGGKPAKTGGLVDRINAFLSDVQRQMEEEAAKKREAGATDLSEWSQLMDEPVAVKPARPAVEESLDDLTLDVAVPAPEPKPAPPVRTVKPPGARKPRKVESPPSAPPQPAMVAHRKPLAKKGVTKASLRRAIVWSEILGPPVSLRDKRDGHFNLKRLF